MHSHPKCPHCGSTDTSRSHRRPIERLLVILRPYRCEFCSRRFRIFASLNPRKKADEAPRPNSPA